MDTYPQISCVHCIAAGDLTEGTGTHERDGWSVCATHQHMPVIRDVASKVRCTSGASYRMRLDPATGDAAYSPQREAAVVACPGCGTELNVNVTIDDSRIERVADAAIAKHMTALADSIGTWQRS